MNKILSTLVIIAPLVAIALANPALAGETKSKNYVGPTVLFGNGLTAFGANSKIGIADSFSARPFILFFGNVANTRANAVAYGADITYDYTFPQSDLTVYGGARLAAVTVSDGSNSASVGASGWIIGSDYRVSDSLVLNANVNGGSIGVGVAINF